MSWDTATRYRILLEINNAVVIQTSREGLFKVFWRMNSESISLTTA
jgi:hypothetical protein